MKKAVERIEPFVFLAILAFWLVPVWALDYFVTGDGPCHLFNTKILLDWSGRVQRDFYHPFYFLNTNFDPNWLFNLVTMPLMAAFGPSLAEKMFFTIYILGFGLGFRFLVGQINPEAKFIGAVGSLFCIHKLLMTGFLNNSLSLMLWFWVAGWWWYKRDDRSLGSIAVMACLLLLQFSAHPMGLTFGGMMLASMLVGLFIFEYRNTGWQASKRGFIDRLNRLLISALPIIVLFGEFMLRREWSEDKNEPDIKNILEGIGKLSTLVTMNSTERDLASAVAILCVLLFVGALMWRIRERRLVAADGLMLFFVLVMYSVLNPPSSMSGGLDVPFRMGMLPYFALLFWAATARFPDLAKGVTLLGTLVIAAGFLGARLPIHRNASEYAKEIVGADVHIGNPATILTLNYDWAGQTPDGKTIANRVWLFTHVDCYLGTTRSAAISDNYETNYWYFPMIARSAPNMYTSTDKDGINFDHRPPRADILNYNRRSGQNIDYVLLLSYRDEFRDHPYTQEVFSQLDSAYNKVFVSEFGRAILYKRKGL